MRKANSLRVDLDKLPPHMRPKDHVQAPDTGQPKQIAQSPLRTLLAGRTTGGHVPTDTSREGVMHAVAFDVDHRHIAMIAGISEAELKSLYAEELEIGKPLVMNDLEVSVYNIGVDKYHKDALRAATWVLEKIGGERYLPRSRAEITGANGRPLQIDHRTQTIDPTLLTGDQRDALREILTSAMKLAAPQSEPVMGNPMTSIGKPMDQQVIEGRYAEAENVEDLLR